jgi:hypothetical protein
MHQWEVERSVKEMVWRVGAKDETDGNISDFKISGSENHHRSMNGTPARGGARLEEDDQTV